MGLAFMMLRRFIAYHACLGVRQYMLYASAAQAATLQLHWKSAPVEGAFWRPP